MDAKSKTLIFTFLKSFSVYHPNENVENSYPLIDVSLMSQFCFSTYLPVSERISYNEPVSNF